MAWKPQKANQTEVISFIELELKEIHKYFILG
jgi:hypothetical protein